MPYNDRETKRHVWSVAKPFFRRSLASFLLYRLDCHIGCSEQMKISLGSAVSHKILDSSSFGRLSRRDFCCTPEGDAVLDVEVEDMIEIF